MSTHCNTRCSLQALHLPAYRNSTSFPDPCCDTRARLPALPVHPTRLNYLQFYSSSCSDGLAAGKRKKKKITSPPTLSVQFCCSCYLYVNHQLMNNMTCIAAPGCCSLHKSVIMSGVSRQHDSISFVLFFLLVNRNGTSSASSLGLADLDAFSDVPAQSTAIRYCQCHRHALKYFSLMCHSAVHNVFCFVFLNHRKSENSILLFLIQLSGDVTSCRPNMTDYS